MSLQIIDELTEQVKGVTEEVATEIEQSIEQLANLDTTVQTLSTTLENSRSRADQSFSDFEQIITQFEAGLEPQIQKAQAHLQSVTERITAIDGQVGIVLDQMNTQFEEIQAGARSLLADVETEAGETNQKFAVLHTSTTNLEAIAVELVDEAEESVLTLQDVSEQAQAAFSDRKQVLIGQFDALRTEAEEKLNAVTANFDELIAEGTSSLESLNDSVESTFQSSMDSLAQKLTEDAVNHFSDASDTLGDGMDMVKGSTEEKRGLLDGELGSVFGSIGDVLDAVEPVTDIISQIRKLM